MIKLEVTFPLTEREAGFLASLNMTPLIVGAGRPEAPAATPAPPPAAEAPAPTKDDDARSTRELMAAVAEAKDIATVQGMLAARGVKRLPDLDEAGETAFRAELLAVLA